MMMNARNRYPFTASQWDELEHQALIFKYMMSGVPVPPDLIFTVKTTTSSYQPNLGWGSFQMGFGRKVDREPWRCRRTDGKKWRCSKEAYPDSKYCERHMHRGRNRSRKPVESTIINTTSTSSPPITPFHPFLSPPPSSTPSMSHQNNTTHHLFFDSASYPKLVDENYRYVHGMREDVEKSGSYMPLTRSSASEYSHLFYQSVSDGSKHEKQQEELEEEEEEEERNCFVLGSDFKATTRPVIKVERQVETRKPFHHFFGQSNGGDSWLEMDQKNQSNNNAASFFGNNFSASMPLSTQDLFASKNRYHIDG